MYKYDTDTTRGSILRETFIINRSPGFMNVSNVHPTIDQIITITAKYDKNSPIKPKYIIFKINGITIKDEKGNAKTAPIINNTLTITYKIPSNLIVKNYTIKTVFLIDETRIEVIKQYKYNKHQHIIAENKTTNNKTQVWITGKRYNKNMYKNQRKNTNSKSNHH